MDVKPINCNIKPAVHIRVGDPKVDFHSGCSVVDVTFPNTFYVEVSKSINKFLNALLERCLFVDQSYSWMKSILVYYWPNVFIIYINIDFYFVHFTDSRD